MSTIEVLTLVGGIISGLALFLYGMNVMSAGLTKASGGKLEQFLSGVTKNRLTAYLFGVGVTALVQSSSASTVMVVGLVNSGIMTLKEAVNIILGANLGTTFTAWLLSLNAISSDNLILTLFKPATFTPYLAIIGVGLLMFAKSDRKKTIASILIGFSVLMFGMQMMSSAVSPLKDSPAFVRFLTSFSNPAIGFLVGILFTMIIQSSAGTIGVLQALSLSISVTYGMSIPVVIGAEVGTCITAILSSFGANRNGKRAALMHLYFNIIKAGIFMILFYSLNAVVHFAFLGRDAGMIGIAGIHTLVNLVATPLMLPFSGILVTLAMKSIPEDAREQEEEASERSLSVLDERFLTNPPFALEQARNAAAKMAGYTLECTREATSLVFDYSDERAAKVITLEDRIDHYEDKLSSYLVQISAADLGQKDNQVFSVLLHSIGDLERISDHALNIQQSAEKMHSTGRMFSARAREEVGIFIAAVDEISERTIRAFQGMDRELAATVQPLEDVIDMLNMEVKRRHVRRLQKGKCTIDLGFSLTDIATDLERIADHCSNISLALMLADKPDFGSHEFEDSLRKKESPEYEAMIADYEQKYQLPVYGKYQGKAAENPGQASATSAAAALHADGAAPAPATGGAASAPAAGGAAGGAPAFSAGSAASSPAAGGAVPGNSVKPATGKEPANGFSKNPFTGSNALDSSPLHRYSYADEQEQLAKRKNKKKKEKGKKKK